MLVALAFWVTFTALLAWGQGLLMPTLKQEKPNTPEANRTNFALHYIFGAAWALPGFLFWYYTERWELIAIAVLVRIALFDPVLNYAEGSPVFAVGGSANSDKLIQFLAVKSGIPAAYLSAVFKALALLVLVVGMWKFCG